MFGQASMSVAMEVVVMQVVVGMRSMENDDYMVAYDVKAEVEVEMAKSKKTEPLVVKTVVVKTVVIKTAVIKTVVVKMVVVKTVVVKTVVVKTVTLEDRTLYKYH